jgi:hypothetical protein
MSLSDGEIQANYTSQGWSSIDEGEKTQCTRCSASSVKPGTSELCLCRIPNRNTHLPRFITLCERCAKSLGYVAEVT